MQNYGERIKYVRTQLEFTPEEFAEKLGISQRILELIENGHVPPGESTLLNFINIVIEYLGHQKFLMVFLFTPI